MKKDPKSSKSRFASNPYCSIVKAHLPKGYKLREQKLRGNTAGYATSHHEIICEPITDRERLFIFLHECGHVHNRHLRQNTDIPSWQEEYEADQYAIQAMRSHKIPIPKIVLQHHKNMVRMALNLDPDGTDNVKILRYAYGKDWRQNRSD